MFRTSVGGALVDPVCVHIVKEVVGTEVLNECADVWSCVGRNDGAVAETIGGVWRGNWIELAAQVAVLGVLRKPFSTVSVGERSFVVEKVSGAHIRIHCRSQATGREESRYWPAAFDLPLLDQCKSTRIE